VSKQQGFIKSPGKVKGYNRKKKTVGKNPEKLKETRVNTLLIWAWSVSNIKIHIICTCTAVPRNKVFDYRE
jgi:hypothetical protein